MLSEKIMSEKYKRKNQKKGDKQKELVEGNLKKPAIGIIATHNNSDEVARSILRAKDRGHQVIVTYEDPDIESVRFAEKLGTKIIHPPKQNGKHTENGEIYTKNGNISSDTTTKLNLDKNRDLKNVLIEAENTYNGSDGLILHTDTDRRIDFEKSLDALKDTKQYTEAIYKSDTDTLVGIPAYNEEDAIKEVVSNAKKHVNNVLVVDDGSKDKTIEKAKEAGAIVVKHKRNKGYGAALKTIFKEADRRKTQNLVILDGDNQHDASDISKLIDKQKETNSDIVIGSRFAEESNTKLPLYRRFGIETVNILTNLSMGIIRSKYRVRDTQCGFRCYNREAISTLAKDDDIGDSMGASTDILYTARRKNFKIEEIGTTVDYEIEDTSSQNPISHGLNLVSNLIATIEKEKPLIVLGLPGLIFVFLGFIFGWLTLQNYISSGIFPVGHAITSVFFVLLGIFSGFTGIILHSLETHLN